jgi:hypothetical protein
MNAKKAIIKDGRKEKNAALDFMLYLKNMVLKIV